MEKPLLSFIGVCCLASFSLAVSAQDFPGIETLMNARERAQSGIDSLSEDQLETLNAWLDRYLQGPVSDTVPVVESVPAVPVTPAAPASPPVAPAVPASPPVADVPAPAPVREFGAPPPEFQPFTSTIKGEFTGWTGDTLFVLENGQVYEQRRPGRWRVRLMDPEVRISKNFLGAYDLEVVSEGRSIGVRRLR